MIDWLAEQFTDFINGLPLLLADPASPSFFVMRAMLGLLVIAALIVCIAYLPTLARSAKGWWNSRKSISRQ